MHPSNWQNCWADTQWLQLGVRDACQVNVEPPYSKEKQLLEQRANETQSN